MEPLCIRLEYDVLQFTMNRWYPQNTYPRTCKSIYSSHKQHWRYKQKLLYKWTPVKAWSMISIMSDRIRFLNLMGGKWVVDVIHTLGLIDALGSSMRLDDLICGRWLSYRQWPSALVVHCCWPESSPCCTTKQTTRVTLAYSDSLSIVCITIRD